MISNFRVKIAFLLLILFVAFLANIGTLVAIPILVLFIIACSKYMPSFFGSYWIPTPAASIERIAKEAKARKSKNFYDLGSGDGRVVIAVAEAGVNAVGVEIDPLKWLLSTARIKLRALDAKILRESFYSADLSKADVIFCYLPNATMAKLEPSMTRLKGKTIITYRIKFPNLKPSRTIKKENLFIYRI